MFCPNCGAENPDYANFCEKCGHNLRGAAPEASEGGFFGNAAAWIRTGRRQWIIGGCIMLAAVLICVIALVWHNGAKKDYETKIQNAGRYLQTLDYEKAEAAYLDAIHIAPKKKEPYIQLADLYMKQGRREEAVAVLKQGKENVDTDTAGTLFVSRIKELEAGEDSYSYVGDTVVSETGLADLGTFPDDGSNRLGLVSAWIRDLDGDGQDEIITTAAEEHKVTDMRIRLYDKQDGKMVMIGELPPETLESETVSYGDSSCEVFAKEQNGNFYLVLKRESMSESYSSTNSSLSVFKIEKGFQRECTVKAQWHRGNEAISINEKAIYSVSELDAAEGSFEEEKAEALATVREALAPYGLEGKAAASEEEGIGSSLVLSGWDEGELSETRISNRERKQTGERTYEGYPVMQVVVEDFTNIRGSLGTDDGDQSSESTETGELRRGDVAACVGMAKSEIESRFGELSDTGDYWSGGAEHVFAQGYEGVTVYFQAYSELPDDQNTCTGIGGTAGSLFDGWGEDALSIEEFGQRSGVFLENIDGDYYGEFDDGCRLVVYTQDGSITRDTGMTILPPSP